MIRSQTFLRRTTIVFCLLVAASYLSSGVNCHGHAHDEPPSFKYSRAANEKKPDGPPHHGHAHDHHGHAHDHHRHAHDHHEHSHDHHGHAHNEPVKQARDFFTVALHACLSTLLISIAPFVILFFIPLNNNGVENQSLLKILLGFASGSLLGTILNPHTVVEYNMKTR